MHAAQHKNLRAIFFALSLFATMLCALCVPAVADEINPVELYTNSWETVALSPDNDVAYYRFVPQETGEYIFKSFYEQSLPQNLIASLYIEETSEQVGEDRSTEGGFQITQRLVEGTPYLLTVTSASDLQGQIGFVVGVMKNSYGRNSNNPIMLAAGNVEYIKTIAAPRDVHWYSFVAETDGEYAIKTEGVDGSELDTQGYLLNAQGEQIAFNDDMEFQKNANFYIRQPLKAGQQYFVRVNAFSNTMGSYKLVIVVPQQGTDQLKAKLEQKSVDLFVGQQQQLRWSITPAQQTPDIVFVSSAPEVIKVDPQGQITALKQGQASVYLFLNGALHAECTVTVNKAQIQNLYFDPSDLEISLGTKVLLEPVVFPAGSEDQLVYTSRDESVATVDPLGALAAHKEGSTVIVVSTRDGGLSAELNLTVTPPKAKYRALLVSERLYSDGRARIGAINTAQGLSDMFQQADMDGEQYEIAIKLDVTKEQLFAAINQTFLEASDSDVSVFYINTHGGVEGGQPYFELHSGERISPAELEQQTHNVRGKIVLILDYCQSGAFIDGQTVFQNEKYIVMTSSSATEDSYRIGSEKTQTEASMATAFGRSLSEGAGWDLIADGKTSLKADANGDGKLTVQELNDYAAIRVQNFLSSSGVEPTPVQTPMLRAQSADLILFQE